MKSCKYLRVCLCVSMCVNKVVVCAMLAGMVGGGVIFMM